MPIKKSRALIDSAVRTLYQFQTGKVQLIKTNIHHLDEKLMGGLKPADVLTIVGESQHGKTHLLEKIERELIKQDVLLVRCAWELEPFKLLVRKLASELNVSATEIINEIPTEEMMPLYKEICEAERSENILYQDEPVSPQVFTEDIEQIMVDNPDRRIVVTVDNLENVLNTGDQKKTMDAITYAVNVLKKKHPFICFILLNQMNRKWMERANDPRQHEPRTSDIYGTGAIYKMSDVVVAVAIPYLIGISDKYMVFPKFKYEYLDEYKVNGSPSAKTASFEPYGRAFYHYLKDRNLGDLTGERNIFIDQFKEKPEEWGDEDNFDDTDIEF